MDRFMRLLRNTAFVLFAAAAIWHGNLAAQSYPDRPLTIVVPYQAGTLADLFARTIGNELAVSLRQPVIIDNRPGAGQVVASSYVARSTPNGYTLMITAMPNVIAPSIQKSLPYAGNTDFAAVAHVVAVTNLLVTSPGLPVSNLREFIALLKANPGKHSYGSAGIGSPIHLFAELFNREAGARSLHVPYKSFQTALADIMTGQVDYGFMTLGAMQFVSAGKLKALGTPSQQRDPVYGQVPTLDEQGMKGFEAAIHYLLVAPRGTPAAIVERLNAAVGAVTGTEAFAAKVRPVGGVSVLKPMTPAQTTAFFAHEDERWKKLVEDQNIALE
jgi:tripartite-type tricarboxylate transporter receptor subunit TctC